MQGNVYQAITLILKFNGFDRMIQIFIWVETDFSLCPTPFFYLALSSYTHLARMYAFCYYSNRTPNVKGSPLRAFYDEFWNLYVFISSLFTSQNGYFNSIGLGWNGNPDVISECELQLIFHKHAQT